jgi:hypothetical protein
VNAARRQAYLQRAKSYLVAVGYTLLQQYYVEPLLHGTGGVPSSLSLAFVFFFVLSRRTQKLT